MLLERRAQMFLHERLPLGYQEVEWIEGTGTQCIDTGFVPSVRCAIAYDASMEITNGIQSGEGVLQFINNKYARLHTLFNEQTKLLSVWSGYDIALETMNITDPSFNRHVFVYSQNNVSIDGVQRSCVSPSNISLSFFLFKRHRNNGDDVWTGRIRKSYCRMWDDNSDLVRNFVPCYRQSDNVIGMYDLCGSICPLTGTPLYINAGTGVFTKGADV